MNIGKLYVGLKSDIERGIEPQPLNTDSIDSFRLRGHLMTQPLDIARLGDTTIEISEENPLFGGEPCRQVLRRMMADIPTDKVLVALTHALQAVVDANGGEHGDTQKIQVHSLWLTAAAKDLLDEEHAVSVADKIKKLLK